jgi:hypothetical protein
MLEVSPVLAQTASAPASVAASVNFTSDSNAVDPRRYSKFDRTASAVGSATMTFGDVLDMVNPLQHIPVVSSVYREMTGDKINPVSRVAGDVLYGGVMGVAAAVAGGIGAVADTVMEAHTGKDVTGTVYAALFGDEKAAAGDGSTQIAAAAQTQGEAPVVQAAAATQATQSPIVIVDAAATASTATDKLAAQETKGFALPPNKLPFGGAIAPVKSMQQQNMAMALASAGAGGVRIGNTVYANRFINGPHLVPAVGASASATGSTTTATTAGQPALITALPAAADGVALPSTPIPSALNDDAMIMRALNMYKSVATGDGRANVGVNVLN